MSSVARESTSNHWCEYYYREPRASARRIADEVDSIVRLVQSRIDVSLERLLE